MSDFSNIARVGPRSLAGNGAASRRCKPRLTRPIAFSLGGISLTAAAKCLRRDLSRILPALKALNDGLATDGGRRT